MENLDQPNSTLAESASAGDSLTAILHDQRRLARQVFQDHRERIKSVESKVVEQIQQLVDELERGRAELQQKVAAQEALSTQLNARKDALEQREQAYLQTCEERRGGVEDAYSELLTQLRSQLSELTVRRKQLDDDELQMRKRTADELQRLRAEYDAKVQNQDALASELKTRLTDLEVKERDLTHQQASFEKHRAEMERRCEELIGQLGVQLEDTSKRRRLLDETEKAIRQQAEQEVERNRALHERQLAEYQQQSQLLEKLTQEVETRQQQLKERERELAERQAAWDHHRVAVEKTCADLLAKLSLQLDEFSQRQAALPLHAGEASPDDQTLAEMTRRCESLLDQLGAQLEEVSNRRRQLEQTEKRLRERELALKDESHDRQLESVEVKCAELLSQLNLQFNDFWQSQSRPVTNNEDASRTDTTHTAVNELAIQCQSLLTQLSGQLEEVGKRRQSLELAEQQLRERELSHRDATYQEQCAAMERRCEELLGKLSGQFDEYWQTRSMGADQPESTPESHVALSEMAVRCQQLLDQLSEQINEVTKRRASLEQAEKSLREQESALKDSVRDQQSSDMERRCEELLTKLSTQFEEYWTRKGAGEVNQSCTAPNDGPLGEMTVRCQQLVDQLGNQLEEVATRRRSLEQSEKRLREKELALKDAAHDQQRSAVEHRCEELLAQLSTQLDGFWQQNGQAEASESSTGASPNTELAKRCEELLEQLGFQLEELGERRREIERTEAQMRDKCAAEAEHQRNEHQEKLRLQESLSKELTARECEVVARERELAERYAAYDKHQSAVELVCEDLLNQLGKQLSEFFKRHGDGPAHIELACETLRQQLGDQIEQLASRRAAIEQREDQLRKREADLLDRMSELSRQSAAQPRAAGSPAEAKSQTPSSSNKSQSGEGAAKPSGASGSLDWETLKKQFLTQMESDVADEIEAAENEARGGVSTVRRISDTERQTIAEIIEQTNQIVAEKDLQIAERDRQIMELETLLRDQSSKLGGVAVGASAIAQMIDQDAIIQEERESLKKLQEDWHAKLRKAELEISIERAKIARERVALEEQVRKLETERDALQAPGPESDKNNAAKKGRWLARLGLTDEGK